MFGRKEVIDVILFIKCIDIVVLVLIIIGFKVFHQETRTFITRKDITNGLI